LKGWSDPKRYKLVKAIPVCTKEQTFAGLLPGEYRIITETCKEDNHRITYVYQVIKDNKNVLVKDN